MVKHFLSGLLSKLLQQVKYEGVDILEDVIRIAEKKKIILELIMIILPENTTEVHYISQEASSSTNLLQPPNIPLKMEVIMK